MPIPSVSIELSLKKRISVDVNWHEDAASWIVNCNEKSREHHKLKIYLMWLTHSVREILPEN